MASTTDEQPHIGNYRLLKTIGKGNFAKVKLARHVLTGREVSLILYILALSEFHTHLFRTDIILELHLFHIFERFFTVY